MAEPQIGGGDITIPLHFTVDGEDERETLVLKPTASAGYALCDEDGGLGTIYQGLMKTNLTTIARVISAGAGIDMERAKYLVFFGSASYIVEFCKTYILVLLAGGRIISEAPPKKKTPETPSA
jgi:hypothetical protein